MEIRPTTIPGCLELLLDVLKDERGRFVKTFHEEVFAGHGLTTRFAEEYYSVSHRGVLRGLHFQVPPRDHIKVVTCLSGAVLDAVVDLRVGSPMYGKYETFTLSAERANLLYLPAGVAHGFFATSDEALLLYKVTTTYSPSHDAGILWSSAGIAWPVIDPVVSARDKALPRLADFKSPFVYSEE